MSKKLPLFYEKTIELVEIPKNPMDVNFWDKLYLKNPPEERYVKIKRAAKKKIFSRILNIAERILTQEQYETFFLFYSFYPHKTMEEISQILGISFNTVRGRLRMAKFNILKFVFQNSLCPSVRDRVGEVLKKIRDERNRGNNNWRQIKRRKNGKR